MHARALAALAALGVGCELVTHSAEFKIPSYGICSQCGYRTDDLLRPPCPPRGVADAGAGATYVFAWRHISIGADPATWTSPGYRVGYDQDCSTRPDGLPAQCAPVLGDAPPSQLVKVPEWTPLPHGIDNALGQRVIGPLVAFAKSAGQPLDVDGQLSASFEAGNAGGLLVVEGWNGAPDDPDVRAAFIGSSKGALTKPPKWDGTDVWISTGDPASYPRVAAYVSGGVLVVDSRSLGEEDTTYDFGSSQLVLQVRLTSRVGPITPRALSFALYGRVNLADTVPQAATLASLLAGGASCDQSATAQVLCANLPNLLRGAADLPSDETPTPGRPCASISFGALIDAYPAHVVGP